MMENFTKTVTQKDIAEFNTKLGAAYCVASIVSGIVWHVNVIDSQHTSPSDLGFDHVEGIASVVNGESYTVHANVFENMWSDLLAMEAKGKLVAITDLDALEAALLPGNVLTALEEFREQEGV